MGKFCRMPSDSIAPFFSQHRHILVREQYDSIKFDRNVTARAHFYCFHNGLQTLTSRLLFFVRFFRCLLTVFNYFGLFLQLFFQVCLMNYIIHSIAFDNF